MIWPKKDQPNGFKRDKQMTRKGRLGLLECTCTCIIYRQERGYRFKSFSVRRKVNFK